MNVKDIFSGGINEARDCYRVTTFLKMFDRLTERILAYSNGSFCDAETQFVMQVDQMKAKQEELTALGSNIEKQFVQFQSALQNGDEFLTNATFKKIEQLVDQFCGMDTDARPLDDRGSGGRDVEWGHLVLGIEKFNECAERRDWVNAVEIYEQLMECTKAYAPEPQ